MNYRHVYHAGNFADLLKHAVLAFCLAYMAQKPKPLRYIETHAGAGLYDLESDAARKTREAHGGILRLLKASRSQALNAFLAPYLAVLEAVNAQAPLADSYNRDAPSLYPPKFYPGSPLIAAHVLRREDRLLLCECQASTLKALKLCLGRDRRAKFFGFDGYQAMAAFIPPIERRGLVMIDPVFESPAEWDTLADCLTNAVHKWPSGSFVAWHPIKVRRQTERFYENLRIRLAAPTLRVEFSTRAAVMAEPPGARQGQTTQSSAHEKSALQSSAHEKSALQLSAHEKSALQSSAHEKSALHACGLVLVNPPFPLYEALNGILPELCAILAHEEFLVCDEPKARALDWLVRERC